MVWVVVVLAIVLVLVSMLVVNVRVSVHLAVGLCWCWVHRVAAHSPGEWALDEYRKRRVVALCLIWFELSVEVYDKATKRQCLQKMSCCVLCDPLLHAKEGRLPIFAIELKSYLRQWWSVIRNQWPEEQRCRYAPQQ